MSRGYEPELALVGGLVAVALATVPDADEYLPIDHRGPTHTIWFVVGMTMLSTLVGGVAGLVIGRPVAVATTVGVAAVISLTSHLLADSITPMGIRPFYPLSMWHHSFGVTPAANPRANTTMFGVGLVFALACQWIVFALP